ncbi:hypothetical protein HYH03_012929 [Edaphochlamys debaryana]|uniref:Uncharacterized protein n=1 Tax=Edaphochlamys debaryana TaxID=47281 RepID=A0A835XPB9_9CHLO|nr:hypothetical protein HYH03_012929 [Edaphochlamys debaryana]|eukprot:KAG2488612.1 hypothetical protein HYH03_012929 [Edaphochlamys debaryana]
MLARRLQQLPSRAAQRDSLLSLLAFGERGRSLCRLQAAAVTSPPTAVAALGGPPPSTPASSRAAAAVASAVAAGLRRTASSVSTAAPVHVASTPSPSPSSTPPPTTTTSTSSTSAPSPTASAPAPLPPSSTEGTHVPWATLGEGLDLIQMRLSLGNTATAESAAAAGCSPSPGPIALEGAAGGISGGAEGSSGEARSGAGAGAGEGEVDGSGCGDAVFSLVAPRDVDALMDFYVDKGLMDADPYWARAWPSAIALAATLLRRPELVRGKVVADLGAGLGLAGLAAALAGAREVVLLDREPLALQCALLSAAASGLPPGAVQPLPYDQLAPYARLLLTPEGRSTAGAAQGGPSASTPTDAGSESASASESGSGSDRSQAVVEAEWRQLMAVAAAIRAEGPAVWSDGPASSSGRTDGGVRTEDGPIVRAHVFDWTAPPDMASLLPPPLSAASKPASGRRPPVRQRRFDVVLACDVLYESAAVGPISELLPALLRPDGGRFLLADPPNRTAHNREAFLERLKDGPLRLRLEEASMEQCQVSHLDNEMVGGLPPTAQAVPVQFLVLRSGLGNDTVGVKL